MDVKVFSRRDRLSKTEEDLVVEASELKDAQQKEYKHGRAEIRQERMRAHRRAASRRISSR
jgi:DNA-directed RNA polymerase subunit beta